MNRIFDEYPQIDEFIESDEMFGDHLHYALSNTNENTLFPPDQDFS